MKRKISILLLIVLVLVFSLGFSMPSVDKNIPQGQETCPHGNGWTKVDGLTGCEYTFQVPLGCRVTSYCYKAATYCSGPVPVNPPIEGEFHLVLNPCRHDLSHASFYVDCSTPTPEPTPTQPEPTPTQPEPTPTQPEPTPTQPEPTPTPNVIIPPTGGNGDPFLLYRGISASVVLSLIGGILALVFFRKK